MFVIVVCSALAALVNLFKFISRHGKAARSRMKPLKDLDINSKASVPRRSLPQLQHDMDQELSNRHIDLDPAGYFIIKIDRRGAVPAILAEFYTNTINQDGYACDPDTGEVIPCGKYERAPTMVFRGKSAKELSVQILEGAQAGQKRFCTHLEHANYLGREFQKAECALLWSYQYVQD